MKKRVRDYEPRIKTAKFVLRLPDKYSLALDGLVGKGVAKSKNALIVELVGRFLSDLRARAEAKL